MNRLTPEQLEEMYPASECILWDGVIKDSGYGVIWTKLPSGKWRKRHAHRVIYQEVHGPIADGLQIDHLCRSRNCVNIDHLEAVPGRDNYLRGTSPWARNAQKTHCKRGHEFTPENTAKRSDGGRRCRACGRLKRRIYDGYATEEDLRIWENGE